MNKQPWTTGRTCQVGSEADRAARKLARRYVRRGVSKTLALRAASRIVLGDIYETSEDWLAYRAHMQGMRAVRRSRAYGLGDPRFLNSFGRAQA